MSVAGSHTMSPVALRSSLRGIRAQTPHTAPSHTALERARNYLLGLQKSDGHWIGELEGDTILESEYVMLMAFLGREHEERPRKAARFILTKQQAHGGWSNYPGGPVELSVSVKAYFALKLTGHDLSAAYMRRAREAIRAHGGAARCNSFTKFYLALLGAFPYANCASVPPEMMLLPKWAYFNIYAMSSWTRTIVIPLSIFSAHKPVRALAPAQGIAELFVEPPHKPLQPCPPTRRWLTWTNFFLGLDQVVKWFESWGPKRIRQAALRRATDWMMEHLQDSDGLGAIYPPIIYTIICLRCLGYADDSPRMRWALKQLDNLMIEEEETLRLQPCFSPVWDTSLTVNALAMCEESRSPARVARNGVKNGYSTTREPSEAIDLGVRWLLGREVRRPGDWSLLNPHLEPGGWFFEYHNGFYPDTDDTAMVLMALARSGAAWRTHLYGENSADNNGGHSAAPKSSECALLPAAASCIPPVQRGLRWLLGMQNKDGGWAAFDRDINREVLTKVPFADHNAMLDPSCPDITARVLEALGQYGYRCDHPQVVRALVLLARTQDRRGCWPGRWGVNYIYGTWQVLVGLESIGYDMGQPMVRRAVHWLKNVQQADGGWGESCASYDDPRLAGQGPVTASQTAWALLALIAAGEANSDPVVRHGIDFLVRTQQPDGNWHEDQFTGTGFPKVFYLKYHLYRLYFPLMALARYAKATGELNQPKDVRDVYADFRERLIA